MSQGLLDGIWDRLGRVGELELRARWEEPGGGSRRGRGRGTVRVEPGMEDGSELLWKEEGHWEPAPGTRLSFRSSYRWRRLEKSLSLEHLRRGPERPVFLVELAADGDGGLRSREPHVCGRDRYRADVALVHGGVRLSWQVRGPEKLQRLESLYRTRVEP